MHGQLGNQMFQYAFARKLQVETGQNITLGFQAVEKCGWKNQITELNISGAVIDCGNSELLASKTNIIQKGIGAIYLLNTYLYKNDFAAEKLRERQIKWQKVLNKCGLYWISTGYFEPRIGKHKDYFIQGHFDNPIFFAGIEDVLKKEFTPRHPVLEKNRDFIEKIQNSNSVAICIRRGDYVNNKRNKFIFDICDKEYFEVAIRKIKERIDNPVFFVFSDDIPWAMNNIKFNAPVYYERCDNPPWETMRLMSFCKHFIISNSTFHWWGQFLSSNTSKVIVSPQYWYNPIYLKESSLIDKEWIIVSINKEKIIKNYEEYKNEFSY